MKKKDWLQIGINIIVTLCIGYALWIAAAGFLHGHYVRAYNDGWRMRDSIQQITDSIDNPYGWMKEKK